MADPSFTISEFCAAERISRALLYRLWRQGQGPRYFLVGTHRRISEQARQDWHKELEAAATVAACVAPSSATTKATD